MVPRPELSWRHLAWLSVLALALACNLGSPSAPTASPTETPRPTRIPDTPTRAPTAVPPTPVIDVPAELSDEGRTLYLQNDVLRVGVDTRWGGAIREIWYEGVNLVNNFDGGRLIGVAFYDSERPPGSDHPNDTGWNPTPSDMHDHTNQPLETSFSDNQLYVRARYLQWFPNDKGGGPARAVETDILVETWIRFFTDPQTIELRYRLTNESGQGHGVHAQEFPFAYVRSPFQRYVSYVGDDPWSKDQVVIRDLPSDQDVAGLDVTTERWAALVNDRDRGLLFWAPQAYPNFTYKHFDNPVPAENRSLYLQPRTYLEIKPNASIETRAYLLIGRWQNRRDRLYELRRHFSFPDIMSPFGFVDSPSPEEHVSGEVTISGWAIDDRGVERIEIRLDGTSVGEAEYGKPRHDVVESHPGMPNGPNHGYIYELDTTMFANGSHQLEVIAIDQAGNTSMLVPGSMLLTVDN